MVRMRRSMRELGSTGENRRGLMMTAASRIACDASSEAALTPNQ
jgi:hypothetical protein